MNNEKVNGQFIAQKSTQKLLLSALFAGYLNCSTVMTVTPGSDIVFLEMSKFLKLKKVTNLPLY